MSWIKERILSWFRHFVSKILKTSHMPKHVAFILDGNRRYARMKGIATKEGHTTGYNKVLKVADWCMDLDITEITIYAFSIQNFQRKKKEVESLMQLFKDKFEDTLEEIDKYIERGICIRIIGNLSYLTEDLRKLVAQIMVMTKHCNKFFFNITIAYMSRDEITYAIKDVIKGVKNNEILTEDINEDLISKCMYTYNSSNPDLLIRTSEETRLSDFLMWQISNTCIYFTDVLWPEFGAWHLFRAIFYYQRCYSDLQRVAGMQNSKPITHNDRVTMYLNKLHHERQVMIENMCQPDTCI